MINLYSLLFMTLVTATLGGASFALFWQTRPMVNTSPTPQPFLAPSPAAVSPTASIQTPSEIRPLNLLERDDVEPGSEFDRFRREFRHAVADRDREFITELLPEQSPLWEKMGEARVWEELEKAIALGCIAEKNSTDVKIDPFTSLWICPPVQSELLQAYPPSAHSPQPRLDWEKNQVVVVGAGVNVRSAPDIDSEAIAIVSNEVLTRSLSPSEEPPDSLSSPLDGWTAIEFSNGETGYIYNRYVYSPLDPQIQFGQIQGKWQLFYFSPTTGVMNNEY